MPTKMLLLLVCGWMYNHMPACMHACGHAHICTHKHACPKTAISLVNPEENDCIWLQVIKSPNHLIAPTPTVLLMSCDFLCILYTRKRDMLTGIC